MCRLAAYVGSQPVALSSLLYDPPHSLEHAAYSPRELLSGSLNVDGTGVAWWSDDAPEPLRYVSTQPPWADPNLPGLAPRISSRTVLAAVRSATPGLPFGPDNVAPFVSGPYAAVHNGWIGGFRGDVGRRLISSLSTGRYAELSSMNDSLVLFLLTLEHVDRDPAAGLAGAAEAAIVEVTDVVAAADVAATLNLVLASGDGVVAVRTSVGAGVNSLYIRNAEQSVWLASEPLDPDPGWAALPEHSLTVVNREGADTRLIDHAGAQR